MKHYTLALFLLLVSVVYSETFDFAHVHAPKGPSIAYAEIFDDTWQTRWTVSKNKEFEGQWRVEEAQSPYTFSGDKGLVVGSPAKKHAISSQFSQVVDNSNKEEFVVQYEVRLQKSLDCGGAYLKLITAATAPKSPSEFNNDTPYTIMFGPDKCGENDKVHFIIRHQNPISKKYEEKHLGSPPKIKRDSLTHLYTLVIRNDSAFQILIDQELVKSGSLFQDFQPPFQPPKEINDPEDKKPSDWIDEAKFPDPHAKKPDDWDEDAPELIDDPNDTKPDTWLDNEPEEIPNPAVTKPEEWDDVLDGDWEAPLIPNPKCAEFGCGVWERKQIRNPAHKGKWKPPMIENPNYKGEWKPIQIPNPNYFELKEPHKLEPISGIGIEIWTMTENILFDNILVTYSKSEAEKFASSTWVKKHAAEESIKSAEDANKAPGILDQIRTNIQSLFEQLQAFVLDPDNVAAVVALAVAVVVLPVALCLCFGGSDSTPKKGRDEKSDKHKSEKSDETASEKSSDKQKTD